MCLNLANKRYTELKILLEDLNKYNKLEEFGLTKEKIFYAYVNHNYEKILSIYNNTDIEELINSPRYSENYTKGVFYKEFSYFFNKNLKDQSKRINNRNFRDDYLVCEDFRDNIFTDDRNHAFKIEYTKQNYLKLYKILKKDNIKYFAMQYPLYDIDLIKKYFNNDNNIIYVENKDNFEEVLNDTNYDEYFTDKFAIISGHKTKKGNKLIVDNILEKILNYINKT